VTDRVTPEPSLLAVLARSLVMVGSVVAANAGRRAASMVVGYAVVGGLFAVSLCFLTLSGYRAISLALGSIYGSLIVGCVYLVAGLVAAVVLQSRRRR
jgi:hypothetical protein